MSTLSRADEKLLKRLRIPQAQKLLLENYWRSKPIRKSKGKMVNLILWLVQLMTIGVFVLSYFTAGTKPFVNIALVLLWLINPAKVVAYCAAAVIIFASVASGKDEAMDRFCANFLPGADRRRWRIYSILSWAALFLLTASGGYFFTSGMIAICWIAMWSLGRFCRGSVESFLEDKAARKPAVKIINTSATRID